MGTSVEAPAGQWDGRERCWCGAPACFEARRLDLNGREAGGCGIPPVGHRPSKGVGRYADFEKRSIRISGRQAPPSAEVPVLAVGVQAWLETADANAEH